MINLNHPDLSQTKFYCFDSSKQQGHLFLPEAPGNN